MAGDWLKFEASTPEKREVFGIAVAMGWPDPDLVVGKLLKIWRWFDQQTIDGNAPSVTLALLDNVCGVTGFAKAMCDVGWLIESGDGVSLPNFDWHNGKTAKSRCLTAKRVASHKSNAKGNAETNAVSVTEALPREEKRREELTTIKPRAERASRLPADWEPDDAEIQFCRTERPDLTLEAVAHRFRDYWAAHPGIKGRKLDWTATWRNWVRNERVGMSARQPVKFDPVAHVNRNRVHT